MIRRLALCLTAVLAFALTACVPSLQGSSGLNGWTARMLSDVNAQRSAAGVAPITWCGTLARDAQAHTNDQAAHNTMSHTGSDGSNIADRANRAGYVHWTALGENVAEGYSGVDAVMNAWMHSPGHRANLLNGTYTNFGAGYAKASNGTPYWTQDFGRNGAC